VGTPLEGVVAQLPVPLEARPHPPDLLHRPPTRGVAVVLGTPGLPRPRVGLVAPGAAHHVEMTEDRRDTPQLPAMKTPG